MNRKLSNISRELKVKISDLVTFLNLHGFDVSESPDELISATAYDIAKYNIHSFLSKKSDAVKVENPKTSLGTEHIPLELKIIEAAAKDKKLIERIIGFCPYKWDYVVAKYHGVCSQPVQFGLFDEVICGLLLKEKMPAEKIGRLLGFDIMKDPAEEEILFMAIKDLKNDKMIEGDENLFWLTTTGKEYASSGVKFSTFERDFELYFDLTTDLVDSAKQVLSKVKSEKVNVSRPKIDWDLDAIKQIAESQAPEIHFPEKDFLLQSAEFIEADVYIASVWVVLFENFRDNTIRAIVYDENQGKIISELSETIDDREDIKSALLEELVSLEESPIEITTDEKSLEQLESERELISKQEAIDKAIDDNDLEEVIQIKKDVDKIKRHFTTLEFEVELKRLFDTTADELWIISPWIKKAAIRRIPFFEAYIKKGGKIFIGYSEPENTTDVMVLTEAMEKLEVLEKRYPNNFYINALPFFHWKNVWLRKDSDSNIYYTGSYNILSFFVQQGSQRVRQEEMVRLDWNYDAQVKFQEVLELFGLRYMVMIDKQFESLSSDQPKTIDRAYIQKVKAFDGQKLKPFIEKKLKKFDTLYQIFEKKKQIYLIDIRRKFFQQRIDHYKAEALAASKKFIPPETKRRLKSDFEGLRDEFLEFTDLQMLAYPVSEQINKLKEYSQFSPNNRR